MKKSLVLLLMVAMVMPNAKAEVNRKAAKWVAGISGGVCAVATAVQLVQLYRNNNDQRDAAKDIVSLRLCKGLKKLYKNDPVSFCAYVVGVVSGLTCAGSSSALIVDSLIKKVKNNETPNEDEGESTLMEDVD